MRKKKDGKSLYLSTLFDALGMGCMRCTVTGMMDIFLVRNVWTKISNYP